MKQEQILNLILEMDSEQILQLNNLFCEHANYHDDYIYLNDEDFFETWGASGYEVARSTFYGDYNFSHDYVKFNGYGNLESMSYLDKDSFPDSAENIAEYISENFEDFEDFFINL